MTRDELFYKPVKESAKDHQILFWGCMHYGHDPKWDVPLWKMRGFESSGHHDESLVQNWNSKATPDTVGFLLGDTIFGFDAEVRATNLFSRLLFKKLYVMPGNHQAGWKQLFHACDETHRAPHGGEVVFAPNYLEAYVNGQPVVMCHYPILSWNGQGKGSWMLFAHVHGSLSRSEIGKAYLSHGFCKEVSVETCPRPVSYGEIKAEFKGRQMFSPDHHGEVGSTPFS